MSVSHSRFISKTVAASIGLGSLGSPLESNRWVIWGKCSIYIRKTPRSLGGTRVEALDIANVSIMPMGTGTFTELLDRLESGGNHRAIYIESVLNERLEAFLAKRGYSMDDRNCYPPSFYKVF